MQHMNATPPPAPRMTAQQARDICERLGLREENKAFAATAPELNTEQRRLITAMLRSVMYPTGTNK